MRQVLTGILILASLILPSGSKATHIVGGEIFYTRIADSYYEITLIIYRDCINGIPYFDSPAYIGVFDSSNNRIKNIEVFFSDVDTIPIEINDSCTKLVNSVCYEVATYHAFDSLPPIPGGYTLVYDRCCWNASVVNIYDALGSGITVVTYIPDTSVAIYNSSPKFSNRTPPFLCLNKQLEFDHSAIDPDGDSLVYSIFTPLNCTDAIWSSGPPKPPPYYPLTYMPPYSISNVMGGVPLAINAKTGLLTAVPMVIGQFVFGVKVLEYRDNVLIGETTRSYQFNVEACMNVTNAVFDNPIESCGDSLIQFVNKSNGASSYYWNFGDAGSFDSVSTEASPEHGFTSVGSYTVQLIAFSNKGDVCNDTTTGKVFIYDEPVGDFDYNEETCLNYVRFLDKSLAPQVNVTDWFWRFGDGEISDKQNPYHYYNLKEEPQTFLVTLAITDENGCVDTITKGYTGVNRLYAVEEIGASKLIIYPRLDSTELHAYAPNSVSYRWSPKESLSDPFSQYTVAKPETTTKYTITVTDTRGCEAENFITIVVHEYSCGEGEIYVPNAFTPNGDGENDYFRVRGEEISSLELNVYNRWGEAVFESSDAIMLDESSAGWDGTYKGTMQDAGVFVFYLKVTCNSGFEFIKKGNVSLIR